MRGECFATPLLHQEECPKLTKRRFSNFWTWKSWRITEVHDGLGFFKVWAILWKKSGSCIFKFEVGTISILILKMVKKWWFQKSSRNIKNEELRCSWLKSASNIMWITIFKWCFHDISKNVMFSDFDRWSVGHVFSRWSCVLSWGEIGQHWPQGECFAHLPALQGGRRLLDC